MKRKVELWLTKSEEEQLKKALEAYLLISNKREELRELLDQLHTSIRNDRSLLPTIAYGTAFSVEENEDDWKRSFCQLQADEIGAICVIGRSGQQLQVTFDKQDQAFKLTSNGNLVMVNQNIGLVKRRFQSMF